MYYSLEEFIDDNKVIPLQVMDLTSSSTMQGWTLNKKLKYLTERKELLYGIWSFEVGGNKYPKNFYRAFANEARLLLLYEHDKMPRLVEFQNKIFEEVQAIQHDPEILSQYYLKHEKQLTLIRYHKDEYIKQRVTDYRYLLKDLPTKHKVLGGVMSLQSEIRLLYQRSFVENWETYNQYIDYILYEDYPILEQSDEEKTSILNLDKALEKRISTPATSETKITDIASNDARPSVEKSVEKKNIKPAEKFNVNVRKSEKKYEKYASNSIAKKNRENYQKEFLLLDDKICFWLSLYKDPRVIFSRHYQAFRDAIETEITINEMSGSMPKPLYDLARELVDYKFEKVEFIKNFLQYREDLIVTEVKKDPKKYLDDYWKEIHSIIHDQDITPEFGKRIHDMYALKSSLLSNSKTLTLFEYGGKK